MVARVALPPWLAEPCIRIGCNEFGFSAWLVAVHAESEAAIRGNRLSLGMEVGSEGFRFREHGDIGRVIIPPPSI
jgi:hypothetical protein